MQRLTSEFIKSVGSSSDFATDAFADGFLDRVAGTRSAAVEWSLQDTSNSSFDACSTPDAAFAPVVPLVGQQAVNGCMTTHRNTTTTWWQWRSLMTDYLLTTAEVHDDLEDRWHCNEVHHSVMTASLGDDCFNCSRHHDFSSQVQIRLLFLQ